MTLLTWWSRWSRSYFDFSSISSSLILHLSDPRGQPDSCPAEQQVRQPGRHHRRQVTPGPQGHPEALQDEISEADENAGGHADECVAPARGRAERNGNQDDDQACPRVCDAGV